MSSCGWLCECLFTYDDWPVTTGPLRLACDDWPGQNGHDFVGASGGDGLAPVVGFGVAEFVQQADGGLHGAEGAK